jgi:hypothetical protein
MRFGPLSPSASLVLSLCFGALFAACAASPPDPGDEEGTGANGGAGGVGKGGSTASGGTGTGGTGTGGTTGGTSTSGGTGATQGGSGGSDNGTAGVITAGVLNGTGGTVAPSLCGQATGSAADKLVDDLEDGDNTVGNGAGDPVPPTRVGYWFTYNSNPASCTPLTMGAECTCRQSPPPDPQGLIPFPPAGNPGNGSMFAAHTSGTGCTVWGAGLGLDFNNCNTKSNAYNVGAYTGISFQYKSNQPLRVLVGTTPNLPTAEGGTCSSDCHNHHGKNFAAATSWTTGTITWSELSGTQQIGSPPADPQTYGEKRAFNPALVINLEFQVDNNGGASFDLWVDNVTFL